MFNVEIVCMSLNRNIIVIAGGICSGKSYISNIIRDYGYKVADSDSIAKKLMKKGEIGYNALVDLFGDEILDTNGELDKKKISDYIFYDYEKKCSIEKIIHPLVLNEIYDIAKSEGILFVETAIAYRSNFYKLGKLWYIYAPEEDRYNRLIEERKVDSKFALRVIEMQRDEDKLKEFADEIICNGKGENPKHKVIGLLQKLNENM